MHSLINQLHTKNYHRIHFTVTRLDWIVDKKENDNLIEKLNHYPPEQNILHITCVNLSKQRETDARCFILIYYNLKA